MNLLRNQRAFPAAAKLIVENINKMTSYNCYLVVSGLDLRHGAKIATMSYVPLPLLNITILIAS